MSRRVLLWALLALFLVVVGLWPAAAAPVGLAATGAAVIVGLIPGPVLLLAAGVAWLRFRPAPAPTTTA